jgi:hypothetical protein
VETIGKSPWSAVLFDRATPFNRDLSSADIENPHGPSGFVPEICADQG